MLNVTVLCTDPAHPVNPWLERWAATQHERGRAQVRILRDWRECEGGDFLFLVSCHQIIRKPTRDLFRHTLVLHASDLPRGRGMSPHVWQVLQGADKLILTLLNAEDALDSGDLWHQLEIPLDGSELYGEINHKLFDAEVELLDWALAHCDLVQARPQSGEPTYFRKRTPADSQIDPEQTLAASFNQLRVADAERYPAWFELRGHRYLIRLEKVASI